MGFAPKSVKRRRHHRNFVLRATVALMEHNAGGSFLVQGRVSTGSKSGRVTRSKAIWQRSRRDYFYKRLSAHTNETKVWWLQAKDGVVRYAMSWGSAYNKAAQDHGIQ